MNVLRAEKRNDLLSLIPAGLSDREIGTQLDIHRETVATGWRRVKRDSCGDACPCEVGLRGAPSVDRPTGTSGPQCHVDLSGSSGEVCVCSQIQQRAAILVAAPST